MNVVITELAARDLEDIVNSLAEANADRAARVLNELRQSCEGLEDMPRRF